MFEFALKALILVVSVYISYRLSRAGINDLKKAREIKRGLKKWNNKEDREHWQQNNGKQTTSGRVLTGINATPKNHIGIRKSHGQKASSKMTQTVKSC